MKAPKKKNREYERETRISFEKALRDMGFDELGARKLRLQCDALADRGASPFAIERHVNEARRKLGQPEAAVDVTLTQPRSEEGLTTEQLEAFARKLEGNGLAHSKPSA